jgi:hypothetical protein
MRLETVIAQRNQSVNPQKGTLLGARYRTLHWRPPEQVLASSPDHSPHIGSIDFPADDPVVEVFSV